MKPVVIGVNDEHTKRARKIKKKEAKIKNKYNPFGPDRSSFSPFKTYLKLTLLSQITFVALKLFGVITWDWGVVLLPLEIPVGLIVMIFLTAFAC